MARQARGRARRNKRPPGNTRRATPTQTDNDKRINENIDKIITYLERELDVFLAQGGTYKEVMNIGRTLLQLRSKSGDRSQEEDDPTPDIRQRFKQRLPEKEGE